MTASERAVDVDAVTRRATGPLPARLQSPRTKLVFLYLRTVGGARPVEIQRALGMRALALYPVLGTLADYGLVDRADGRYVPTVTDA